MKVFELKKYLRSKGGSTVGNKATLIDHLKSMNDGTKIRLIGEDAKLYLQQQSDKENAAVDARSIRT